MDLITLLRAAITSGGGTPASYNRVQLLQQLVTTYGGTPTKFTVTGLLREAIIARGGTPTQQTITALLRELIVVLGATPTTYTEQALLVQLAGLSIGGVVTPPAPVFSTQPSISPGSGTEGVTAFTATNGVASNTTTYTRRWLLNGSAVSTAGFYTPPSAGSLVLEITATGPGGSTIATTAAVTVAAAGGGTPTISTPPAVTGTVTVGNLLTVSDGTWTGSPASYTYQWYSNTTAVEAGATLLSGETGNTFNQTSAVAGLYIFARVLAAGAAGAASSNIVGPVAAAAGLSSTNATRTTANGAAPEVDLTMGADIFDGYILRIQRTATGTDFTSPTLDVAHYVTPSEREVGTITKAALIEDGYSDPSGYYAQRYRWEREDGVVGPWSVITDTVVASVAAFNGTTGVNKHSSLTLTNGNLTLTGADDNVGQQARATVAGANQSQYELTVGTLNANDVISFGLCNTTTNMSTNWARPGVADSNGICISMTSTGFFEGKRNADGQTIASTGSSRAPQTGDVYTLRRDLAGTEIRVWRRRSGTEELMLTLPWSSAGFDYAWAGVARNTTITANFGATAFQHPLDSGYTYYG